MGCKAKSGAQRKALWAAAGRGEIPKAKVKKMTAKKKSKK